MGETRISYCRNCAANCGVVMEVEDEKFISVKPDRQNLMSEGFVCIKGKMAADLHNGAEDRLEQCMKRGEDGVYRPIDKYQAVAEIAAKLREILDRRGPRALAAFFGTTSYSDCVGKPFLKSLMNELGSKAIFSSMTVDQSSKWVTASRLGIWAAGKPVSTETDVIFIVGSNGPVSHQGYPMVPFPGMNYGFYVREFKKRGGKLIVVDPRRSELARQADLFIQPYPGTDGAIFAALIKLVLENPGWHKSGFCARWTVNLAALRDAVAPFDVAAVAARAGVAEADILRAAEWLGTAKKPGLGSGTGMNMAAFSNTAEHLLEVLTGLVGGYLRAGEKLPNPGVLMPRAREEMVLPPNRSWEREPKCHSADFGKIMGEFPASIFPDEVLTPGEKQIRALFVTGANPAICLGEPERTAEALESLELLVTFDPRLDSATARRSHYVIAPTLQFERAETTTFTEMTFHFPFIQYTAQAKKPAPQTMGEDEFFWTLARHLGVQLTLKNLPFGVDFGDVPGGLKIDMAAFPKREELVAWLIEQAGLDPEVVRAHPHGYRVPLDEVVLAEPALDDGARMDLCPADVAEEIAEMHAALMETPAAPGYLLSARRIVETFNSSFLGHDITLRAHHTNRLNMHPRDLAALGLTAEDAVRVTSRHGSLIGYVRPDDTMKPGVVSMNHCWGGGRAEDPFFLNGAHTGRLVSLTHGVQPINRMPLQSGIPVALEKLNFRYEDALNGNVPAAMAEA